MDGNGQQTILLVDDSAPTRLLCERVLCRDGFAIAHAVNGAEAIEKAREVLPHAIIMDLLMPVMDGLEATRALRSDELTRSIPIIITSARTDQDSLAEGLAAGADEYVFKPIRAREFRLRVRSMVRLREAQLQTERANTSLQRRTELLAELNRFCEKVLTNHGVESTCRLIVETAADLTRSDRVSLLIPDNSGEWFNFGYAVGIDESIWRETRVPLDSPVAGQVFNTESGIVVSHVDNEMLTSGGYDTSGFASLPLVCATLRSQAGPIGVLNVTGRRDGTKYEPDEIEALRQFTQTAALALNNVLTRQKLDATRDSVIFSMAKLSEYRHQETGKHLERVRDLSVLLAQHLATDPRIPEQIDDQFINDLRRAAPLHDIGKVAIPDAVLLKNGRFTAGEFELMKNHSTIGAATLESVISSGHEVGFLQMAMDIARYHHERFDGKGYPHGLAGDDIPICGRIVCLADAYDAIRTRREYKPPRSHEEATAEILRASGGQFDPRIVQAYCALEEQFQATYDAYEENPNEASAEETSESEAVLVAW